MAYNVPRICAVLERSEVIVANALLGESASDHSLHNVE
jgi:hypothetical protein